MYVESFYTGVD